MHAIMLRRCEQARTMTTCHPLARRASDTARPRPLEAPVTTATSGLPPPRGPVPSHGSALFLAAGVGSEPQPGGELGREEAGQPGGEDEEVEGVPHAAGQAPFSREEGEGRGSGEGKVKAVHLLPPRGATILGASPHPSPSHASCTAACTWPGARAIVEEAHKKEGPRVPDSLLARPRELVGLCGRGYPGRFPRSVMSMSRAPGVVRLSPPAAVPGRQRVTVSARTAAFRSRGFGVCRVGGRQALVVRAEEDAAAKVPGERAARARGGSGYSRFIGKRDGSPEAGDVEAGGGAKVLRRRLHSSAASRDRSLTNPRALRAHSLLLQAPPRGPFTRPISTSPSVSSSSLRPCANLHCAGDPLSVALAPPLSSSRWATGGRPRGRSLCAPSSCRLCPSCT